MEGDDEGALLRERRGEGQSEQESSSGSRNRFETRLMEILCVARYVMR